MMEKPKPPDQRQLHDTITTPFPNCFRIFDGWDKMAIYGVEEAEMLIHALAEWVEYKRQLELWESAERDREHEL